MFYWGMTEGLYTANIVVECRKQHIMLSVQIFQECLMGRQEEIVNLGPFMVWMRLKICFICFTMAQKKNMEKTALLNSKNLSVFKRD